MTPQQDARPDRLTIGALRVAVGVAFVAAAIGLLAPELRIAAPLALGVVIAAPLFRVVGRIARWWREGDLRFVAVGSTLVAVVVVSALVAMR